MEFDQLLIALQSRAAQYDQSGEWPSASLEKLNTATISRWGIPEEYGGETHSALEFAKMYCQLAEACLLTTFILTQRNAAVQRIVASENEALKSRYLPLLAEGKLFTTVGISHLSTSRQHLQKPAVTAMETDQGYLLSGFVPWITAALKADVVVTGGTLDDGRQVLCLIPASHSGVSINDAVHLMALSASLTGGMQLDNVLVPFSDVIVEPIENVMKSGGGGTGSTTTSALALGVSRRVLSVLRKEANNRPDLEDVVLPLEQEFQKLREDLNCIFSPENQVEGNRIKMLMEALRREANSLVLRSSQACLGATKGAGYVSGHVAERSIREAMFFLVWSCPQPVVTANLLELACGNPIMP